MVEEAAAECKEVTERTGNQEVKNIFKLWEIMTY